MSWESYLQWWWGLGHGGNSLWLVWIVEFKEPTRHVFSCMFNSFSPLPASSGSFPPSSEITAVRGVGQKAGFVLCSYSVLSLGSAWPASLGRLWHSGSLSSFHYLYLLLQPLILFKNATSYQEHLPCSLLSGASKPLTFTMLVVHVERQSSL